MDPKQKVDYQVFGVIYFEPERLLSGADLIQLWRHTSVFGEHPTVARFWRQGDTPNAEKRTSIKLGDTAVLERLVGNGVTPILGGASHNPRHGRFEDCDFLFSHDNPGRCFGYETLPLFLMGCSGRWFERVGAQAMVELYKKQLEIADKYSPPYAFVDIASSGDCYSGFAYVSYFSLNNRLHRWAEQIKFLYACTKRRDQARGIYWGNYFGIAILNRLGGRERFLARFRAQARDTFGKPDALIWEFTNGVFVSLCLDPLGCRPGARLDGAAGQDLHWLIMELGSHGVLNPWADEPLPRTGE